MGKFWQLLVLVCMPILASSISIEDSLILHLNQLDDTSRLTKLIQSSTSYIDRDYEVSLQLAEWAVSLSDSINSAPKKINALHHLGGVYFKIQEYDTVIRLYKQAFQIAQDVKPTTERLVAINISLGNAYYRKTEISQSLLYYQEALSIAKELGVQGFDQRLENSKKLLATSEESIIDVALNSGFKSVSHYSRKFKEKYSISPSEYKLTFSGK
ncbi:MAG: hypothetical protein CL840_21095 [Crocinitomicaceae bacterium]|nr:hypothetical protein [Crocinitomicaceae bacterium]|tara:strand:- start:13259 stop:13897 length:639 start_codon:yes stop_codon:yes gene_type:complete